MKKWQIKQLIAAGAAAACLAIAVFFPGLSLRIAAGICFVCWMIVWVRWDRKRIKSLWINESETIHHEWIGIFNHYRHDWLNDLQILYGYAQLNKLEQVLSSIQKVKDKLSSDSAICRLGIPSLISELFSWKVKHIPLQLHIALGEDINLSDIPLPSEMVRELAFNMIAAFCEHSAVAHSAANTLRLLIDTDGRFLILDFEYTGGYDSAALANRLQRTIKEAGGHFESMNEFREGEADIAFRIPFTA